VEGPVPEAVKSEIVAGFGPDSIAGVAALLPEIDELPLNPPYERVLRAIVRLAEGDVDQLRYYAGEARKDWRDVLYWTGL